MKALGAHHSNSTDLVIATVVVNEEDVVKLYGAFLTYFKTDKIRPLVTLLDKLVITYQNRKVFQILCAKAAVNLTVVQKSTISRLLPYFLKSLTDSSNSSLFKQYTN